MLAGVCALHPDRAAAFTCARCGDNGCEACARRAVPTAAPLCEACWRRREERVSALAKDDGTAVGWYALGFGVFALVPLMWPAQLGAVVLAVVAARRSAPGTRPRTLAWIGGALGVLGMIGTALSFGWIVAGA